MPFVIHLRLHYQLLFLSPLFVWGFALSGVQLTLRALAGFAAFHLFLYGGITAYNSYYDRDEGPVGGLRAPPPVTEGLLTFSIAVQGLGLALALWASPVLVLPYALVMILSVLYSHSSFRWKARPLLSLCVVAFGQGTVGFLAGWLCGASTARSLIQSEEGRLGALVATLMTVGLYPLTQIYQLDEDRTRGDRTFSVAYGTNASFRFALVCIGAGALCMVVLVARRFGPFDALVVGTGYGILLAIVAIWRRRFRADVTSNFQALHRLHLAVSIATLGYVSARLVLP